MSHPDISVGPDLETKGASCAIEPDCGASGGAFRLWALREALKTGEAAIAEDDRSRESMSKMATSIIGWALPLSTVAIAFVASPSQPAGLRFGALVFAIFATTSCLLSFCVVKGRDWKSAAIVPDIWLDLIDRDGPPLTEAFILRERIKAVIIGCDHNAAQLAILRKRSALAWKALLAAPMFGGAACILALPRTAQWLHAARHFIFR